MLEGETDKNWYKSEKHLKREGYKQMDPDVERQHVGVSDSGQVVSSMTLIKSERLQVTVASADTNPRRVTQTRRERPRPRPCWRPLRVVMCYTPNDIKVNDSHSAGDADTGCMGISLSVCLCLHTAYSTYQRLSKSSLSQTQVMFSLWQCSRVIFGCE